MATGKQHFKPHAGPPPLECISHFQIGKPHWIHWWLSTLLIGSLEIPGVDHGCRWSKEFSENHGAACSWMHYSTHSHNLDNRWWFYANQGRLESENLRGDAPRCLAPEISQCRHSEIERKIAYFSRTKRHSLTLSPNGFDTHSRFILQRRHPEFNVLKDRMVSGYSVAEKK